MREYRIVRCDLWWNIYRKKQVWRMMMLQYLNWKWLWGTNKLLAKTFYKREDAEGALVVARHNEWKESD